MVGTDIWRYQLFIVSLLLFWKHLKTLSIYLAAEVPGATKRGPSIADRRKHRQGTMMRWCRIRLVILGLILCVVDLVSGTCGQRFTDPASSALLADVVIEGKVRKANDPDPDGTYNITVAIRKTILKGSERVHNGVIPKKITVSRFRKDGVDTRNCVGSVQEGRTYFFFLKDIAHPKGLHFEISAMPVKKTKNMATELRKILCDGCAQKPTISMLTGPDSLPAGSNVTLKCSAEGKPSPEFSWYKDGILLPPTRKGKVRIKSRKRQSQLQIKNATQSDAGLYQCVVNNAVGEARKDFTVKVASARQAVRCEKQTFCLNGGTCMYSEGVDITFCQCPELWAGRRCELLDAISVRGDYYHQAALLYERTLITIGIVIALLVFVIICIASYVLAKKRRQRFEERVKRRQTQRSGQNQPAICVESKSDPQTRPKKGPESRNEHLPSDSAPQQQQQQQRHIMLQDSSSPPPYQPSHGNVSEVPRQQHSNMNLDRSGNQCESRRRLVASSVYENYEGSEPHKFSNGSDFQGSGSVVAALKPENIEMNILEEMDKSDKKVISNKDGTTICMNDGEHTRSVDVPLPPQLNFSSLDSLQPDYQISKISSLTLESSEPLTSSCSESPSSLLLPSAQRFQDEAFSRDENDTAAHPLLQNPKKYFHVDSHDQSQRPSESKSDKDLLRHLLNNRRRGTHNSQSCGSQETNQLLNSIPKLTHSNTFPKSKVNGLTSDLYSESDEEEEEEVIAVPYEKQLHVSDEDLDLSKETLANSSFLSMNSSSNQANREEWVMGLLPNLGSSRLGIRKYQSEEGPAYNKLINRSLAFLQDSARSRSLEDPPGIGSASPSPGKLRSTVAGSPDVETYDVSQQPTHVLNRLYPYDPNDDPTPWDGEISRIDFSNLTQEEREKQNRLKDVLPDQQAIPI